MSSMVVFAPHKVAVTSAWALALICVLASAFDGSAGKESAGNVGDLGSIPELERSAGEEKGYPLPYSGLENSMDYIVHGVTKSWTQLSNIDFHFQSMLAI